MMRRVFVPRRAAALAVCAALFASSSGCSKSGPEVPELFPVSGKVTFQGKPLAGAKLVFVSEKKEDPKRPSTERPHAETDAEGGYELMWGDDQSGAPAGKYKVMILAFQEVDETFDNETKPPSLIPERYNNPAASGLTAVVKEEDENVANFELVP